MEREGRRKRPGAGCSAGEERRTRARVAGGGGRDDDVAVVDRTATEDEVEEFFAIVRRMHDAARHLSGGRGGGKVSARKEGRKEEEESLFRWRPAFKWEDFEEGSYNNAVEAVVGKGEASPGAAAVVRRGKREERVAENGIAASLDLNAEPEPEIVLGQ